MFLHMKIIASFLLTVGLTLAAGSASAQYNPQLIGEYRDWAAWVNGADGSKVCFIASKPKSSTPKGAKRGDIYFYVTHRPSRGITGEVAVRIGYPFSKKNEGIIKIGSREFALRFDGDRGWPIPASEDSRVVTAMKAGSKMTVRGVSSRGTKTSDSYSLLGFTAAFNAMSKACK
jgi:hypothetical protein